MRLTRPKTPTVKISIHEYHGSQKYLKGVTISVYNTDLAEIEKIIRKALKDAEAKEVEFRKVEYRI